VIENNFMEIATNKLNEQLNNIFKDRNFIIVQNKYLASFDLPFNVDFKIPYFSYKKIQKLYSQKKTIISDPKSQPTFEKINGHILKLYRKTESRTSFKDGAFQYLISKFKNPLR